MVSGSILLSILVQIVVAGIVFWLLWWLIGFIALPQPFAKVAQVILAVVAVIFLINLVLTFSGHPMVRW